MLVRGGRRLLGSILILITLPGLVFSHPGGLDANGGHHNRKTGEYHYHQKRANSSARATRQEKSPRQSTQISSAIREQRLNEYFRQANENVGALSCDQTIYERDVSQSVKEFIKSRDGNQCVICGSTYKLEVDHKRALQNGGDNSIANLATLCDDCHTAKTRMDSSLRRKRERLCKD